MFGVVGPETWNVVGSAITVSCLALLFDQYVGVVVVHCAIRDFI